MKFQETVPAELISRLKEKVWYRHGIYRTVLLWAIELLPHLDKKSFEEEGISKGLENAIEIGGEFFIVQKEFDEFCKLYDEKLVDGVPYLKKYIIDYNRDIDKALAESRRIGAHDVTALTDKKLGELFLEHFECIKPLHHWLWSMEFLNDSLDRKIKSVMARVYPTWSSLQVDTFLNNASYTFKRQFFQQELDEVALLKDVDDPKVQSMFEKYRWLKMYFIDEAPFSFDEYRQRIQDFLKDGATVRQQIQKSREDAEQAKKIAGSVIDLELREYLFLMQELAYLKTYRIDVYTLAFYYVINLRNEIMRRLGLSFAEFLDHTKSEVVDALNGTPLSKEELAARAVWCEVKVNGERATFKGKEVVAQVRAAIWDENERPETIKGTVAYHGKVRGRVVVSFSSKDIYRVQQGDILVCNLTNPDYNPVFKKLSGIVTDEGGVLCHSAIMAREFKIPCVIGTKIATKVLKDGDMIEVDAENGVVTRIQ